MLGRGEEIGGGRERPSILADAYEAVLAAVYLDGGFKPVERIITKWFTVYIESPTLSNSDYKTMLQEIVQEKTGQTLVYNLTGEQGPDHNKSFTVEVCLNGLFIGTGKGKSKKLAEQDAAKAAIEKLSK